MNHHLRPILIPAKAHRPAVGYLVLLLSSLSLAAATPAPPPLIPRAGNFYDQYRLLQQRNIFDQNRIYSGPSTTDHQPAVIQNTLTLTGLVREGGAYAAFIEDSRGAVTTKYHIGDTIDGGKMTSAGMDYITFTTGTRTTRVGLGQTLQGGPPASATPTATTAPSGPGGDILERLRQRRLQELQGSK